MLRNLMCISIFGLLCSGSVAIAEDRIKVGAMAPASIVAEFITGEWATVHKSACPVLVHRDAVKVAIFAKNLDDALVPLIEAMEEVVAGDSSLKWSFVFVSHENAPTPSHQEWDALVANVKKRTDEKKIRHLSVGLMQRIPDPRNSRANPKLGFLEDGEVVVMLICPDGNRQRGVIQFEKKIKSAELDEQSIRTVKDEIKKTLAAVSIPTPPSKAD